MAYRMYNKEAHFGLYDEITKELMPLYFADIKVDLIDKFAKIYLTHKYFNPSKKDVDTVFKFPEEFFQSFDGFTVEKNGKTFIGAVGKKEIIQRKFIFYNDGETKVEAEHFEPKKVFHHLFLEIGNLLPGESISITLIYDQVIDLSENGQFLLQLSLSLTPQFVPSCDSYSFITYDLIKKFVFEGNIDRKTLREIKKCTNIRYIKEGNELYYQYDINVNIHSSFPIKKIETKNVLPTVIIQPNEFNAKVSLDKFNLNLPTENFELVYEIDQKYLSKPRLLLTKHPKLEDDYAFWYSFNPILMPEVAESRNDIKYYHANYVICFDRSKSSKEKDFQLAKVALLDFIHFLPHTSNSNFEIVSFGTNYKPMFGSFVPISESNREIAINKVEQFTDAMGEVNLLPALEYIRELVKKSPVKTRVFIITYGELKYNYDRIQLIEDTVRLFDIKYYCLGLPRINDRYTEYETENINSIGEKGMGVSDYVEKQSELADKVNDLIDASISFSLKNFHLDFEKYSKEFIQSNIDDDENTNPFHPIKKVVNIYGILPKRYVVNNSIKCNFSLGGNNFSLKEPFDITKAIPSDILHKIIVKLGISSKMKYQVMSSDMLYYYKLYLLPQENNLTAEEMIKKYIEKKRNTPIFSRHLIYIETNKGIEFSLPYQGITSIECLKYLIQMKIGVEPNMQRIIFKKELEDNITLFYYNIQYNSTVYLVFRLPFNPSIIQLVVPITIDGVKTDKTYNFGTEEKFYEMTYEKLRTEVAKLMNIREEEYDFSDGEDDITNNTGKIFFLITEIKLTKKENYDTLPIHKKLIKNRVNGLLEINEKNVSLVNMTMKGWKEFVEKNKTIFSSIVKTMNEENEEYEKIFFNMYIVNYFKIKYNEEYPKFELVLSRIHRAINRRVPSYSYLMKKEFSDTFTL